MADAPLATKQGNELESESAPSGIRPRPLSRLTYKILSFNLLVVFIIAMGLTYLGTTRKNLIETRVDNFGTESSLYAAILGTTLGQSGPGKIKLLSDKLYEFNNHGSQQIIIYDADGKILLKDGSIPTGKFTPLRAKEGKTESVGETILERLENLFSVTFYLPLLPDIEDESSLSSQEQLFGTRGERIAAWSSQDGGLILTASAPLDYEGERIGAIRIIRRDIDVEENFAETRMEIFRFLAIALILTVAHSLYLASLIGHPLRKLAMAAEAYRLNKGRYVDIPDMSERQDEIGELSHAMREMADSLQKRMNSIEQFAADVAHELKNPLTSLRSALETMPLVKAPEDRDTLIGVAIHDVLRMDRLISDISKASRLDAELSRTGLLPVDLRDIILPLIAAARKTASRASVIAVGFDAPLVVRGQGGRLEQVFQNLITNALSFAPADSQVVVTAHATQERVKITVDDSGPGIPENRLEKVFERFYSERPAAEGFGMHSGLGLSISRQIVEAHGGTITAENRKSTEGKIIGARFSVRLKPMG